MLSGNAVAISDVIDFFVLNLPKSFRPHYGHGVYSASNRNEYQKILSGGNARPARKDDNG
jgi:hypothetical protein